MRAEDGRGKGGMRDVQGPQIAAGTFLMMGERVKKLVTSWFALSLMEMVTSDVTPVDDVMCIGFMNGGALPDVYWTTWAESERVRIGKRDVNRNANVEPSTVQQVGVALCKPAGIIPGLSTRSVVLSHLVVDQFDEYSPVLAARACSGSIPALFAADVGFWSKSAVNPAQSDAGAGGADGPNDMVKCTNLKSTLTFPATGGPWSSKLQPMVAPMVLVMPMCLKVYEKPRVTPMLAVKANGL